MVLPCPSCSTQTNSKITLLITFQFLRCPPSFNGTVTLLVLATRNCCGQLQKLLFLSCYPHCDGPLIFSFKKMFPVEDLYRVSIFNHRISKEAYSVFAEAVQKFTSPLRIRGTRPFHPGFLSKLSASLVSLITVGY